MLYGLVESDRLNLGPGRNSTLKSQIRARKISVIPVIALRLRTNRGTRGRYSMSCHARREYCIIMRALLLQNKDMGLLFSIGRTGLY